MIKGWNNRVEIKHLTGRLYSVTFSEVHNFSFELQCWDSLVGTIHADVSENKTRKHRKLIGHFNVNITVPKRLIKIDIKPAHAMRFKQVVAVDDIKSTGDMLQWVREQIVDVTHTAFQGKEEIA